MLLLHGFPTAGHMFHDLIPLLAPQCHMVATELPGIGNTKAPPRARFQYSFDNLANASDLFLEAIGVDRYAIYVFD